MADDTTKPIFVLCIENKDCDDLETRKIYQVLSDPEAEAEGYLRIIDESGEDYLYPSSYFVVISLPDAAIEAMPLNEYVRVGDIRK
ncbi:MAG: hypothetical protein U5R49_19830 [Deltaproteobacteria bacterium]|nr:hypothetical protein [Deltaproteobacteria bacterium]